MSLISKLLSHSQLLPWLVGSILFHLSLVGSALWLNIQPLRLTGSPPPITIHLIDAVEYPDSPAQTEKVQKQKESPSKPQLLETITTTNPKVTPILQKQKEQIKKTIKQTAKKIDLTKKNPIETTQASHQSIAGIHGKTPNQHAIQEALFNADYLHNPKPTYPKLSQRLQEEGQVLLTVRVSKEGTPLDVGIKKSSGYTRLDKAAIQVVKRWQFVPAKQGTFILESQVDVPIQFNLNR